MERTTLIPFLIIAFIILRTPTYYHIVCTTTEHAVPDSNVTKVRRTADPVASNTQPIKLNKSHQHISVVVNEIVPMETH